MRIVVSLTTVPGREESLIKTIESIQNGSLVPDIIYVNLPEWYPKFNCGPSPNLGSKLKNMGVVVNLCKDYGSLTKLVPVLDIEKDPETVVVIVDDDSTYKNHVIRGLVQGYIEFRCPVGFSGIGYPTNDELGCVLMQGHGTTAEILECSFGVLFPVWALEGFPRFEPYSDNSDKYTYFSDDFVFSKFFDSKGISKKVVAYEQAGRFGDDWSTLLTTNEGTQEVSLSKEGNMKRYLKVKLFL